eukprot:4744208-Pleurochrysis_carterae.AAC.2
MCVPAHTDVRTHARSLPDCSCEQARTSARTRANAHMHARTRARTHLHLKPTPRARTRARARTHISSRSGASKCALAYPRATWTHCRREAQQEVHERAHLVASCTALQTSSPTNAIGRGGGRPVFNGVGRGRRYCWRDEGKVGGEGQRKDGQRYGAREICT